jgi:hypothetical protein
MNLYFLSLVKKDQERKKDLANLYVIYEPKSNLTNEYLLTRFPFLSKWDALIVNNEIRFWNGNKIIPKEEYKPEGSINPYFHNEWTNMIGLKLISDKDLIRISKAKLERIMLRYESESLVLSRFKIGKRKYTLFFFLYIQDDLLLLEKKIRSMSGFYVKTDMWKHLEDDLLRIHKKGLYVYFPA